jgi:hypothetical protein
LVMKKRAGLSLPFFCSTASTFGYAFDFFYHSVGKKSVLHSS